MSIRLLALLAGAVPLFAQQENLTAVLWTQSAAEVRASAYQAYRGAEQSLLRALKDPTWTAALEQVPESVSKLPPAVILDLDETVLDNSVSQGRLIREGKTFSEAEWARWVGERRADLIPGAIDFLKVAHANGVAIYYITNRVCDAMKADDPTVENLRRLSVPVSPNRLLCRTDTPDKSLRRAKVANAYRVLLLIGDDFNDFVSIPPAAGNIPGRALLADAHRRYWGERWFMLPNPMYGSWERSIGVEVKRKLEALRQ